MPYTNIEKQREYQRVWKQSRREKYIVLFGGVCVKCGSTTDLEFDHFDSATKVEHKIWTWAEKRIEEELKKCQLLCWVCHRAKSNIEISVERECGDHRKYWQGCRGIAYTAAHTIHSRQYRL